MGGNYLAVSCGTGQFFILDATDVTQLKSVYAGGAGGILYADMFPTRDWHGVFPVNWHSRGIAWYDLNGGKPVVKSTGNPPEGSQMDGIDRLDSGLFVFPVRGSQLALIDPASPGEPKIVEVNGIVADMPVRGIPTVSGDVVAFADGEHTGRLKVCVTASSAAVSQWAAGARALLRAFPLVVAASRADLTHSSGSHGGWRRLRQ